MVHVPTACNPKMTLSSARTGKPVRKISQLSPLTLSIQPRYPRLPPDRLGLLASIISTGGMAMSHKEMKAAKAMDACRV